MTDLHRTPIVSAGVSQQDSAERDILDSFATAGDSFVDLFRSRFAEVEATGRVLDLGCGSAAVAIQFARAFPTSRIDGVDGDSVRLALGRKRVVEAGLQGRITLIEGQLPEARLSRERYGVVLSNNQLHRLDQPDTLWATVRRHADAHAMVFVMDLRRPDNLAFTNRLVQQAAKEAEPAVRQHIHDSLVAAYRPAEVRRCLAAHGCGGLHVQSIGDYQLLVWGRLGADS